MANRPGRRTVGSVAVAAERQVLTGRIAHHHGVEAVPPGDRHLRGAHVDEARPACAERRAGAGVEAVVLPAHGERGADARDGRVGGGQRVVAGVRVEPALVVGIERVRQQRLRHRGGDGVERLRHRRQAAGVARDRRPQVGLAPAHHAGRHRPAPLARLVAGFRDLVARGVEQQELVGQRRGFGVARVCRKRRGQRRADVAGARALVVHLRALVVAVRDVEVRRAASVVPRGEPLELQVVLVVGGHGQAVVAAPVGPRVEHRVPDRHLDPDADALVVGVVLAGELRVGHSPPDDVVAIERRPRIGFGAGDAPWLGHLVHRHHGRVARRGPVHVQVQRRAADADASVVLVEVGELQERVLPLARRGGARVEVRVAAVVAHVVLGDERVAGDAVGLHGRVDRHRVDAGGVVEPLLVRRHLQRGRPSTVDRP